MRPFAARCLMLTVACVFFLGAGCPGGLPLPTPTGPYTSIIVFGDSLSDVGNDYCETAQLAPREPYSAGRFSNGDLWIQHVAAHFGLPMVASRAGGTNYAAGGAGTGTGQNAIAGLPFIENMRTQLTMYTGTPKDTELFAIWGGANDIFDDLNGDKDITPEEMATNVVLVIIDLYERGARNFVVLNLPTFGSLPRYRGTAQEAAATGLSDRFNVSLKDWLDRLEGLDGLKIIRVDAAAFFADRIAHPPPDLTNTTDAAWTGNYLGLDGTLAANPDAYVFWDQIHPSRISHALLGQYVIGVIEANLAAMNNP